MYRSLLSIENDMQIVPTYFTGTHKTKSDILTSISGNISKYVLMTLCYINYNEIDIRILNKLLGVHYIKTSG